MKPLLLALLAIALLLSGCSGSPPTPPANNASRQQNASPPAVIAQTAPAAIVEISSFAFSPPVITVAKGTAITWTNRDPAAHTVTSDTGAFGSPLLQYGESYTHTFRQTGTFFYHCQVHTQMTGRIIVYG